MKQSSQNKQESESSSKAVLYARVSSQEQSCEGFSIPAQLKLLKAYADQNKLLIVQQFVDIESAKNPGRTGFNAMLDFFRKELSRRKQPCRILLVEKTDRLYRNLKDYVSLDQFDIEMHFVKEGAVLSKDSHSSEKFMHGIRLLMARNYLDNLSEEVRKGMTEKAEQGNWPSVAPVGYLNDRQTHLIKIDPDRAPLIRQIFEKYASGEFSLQAICNWAKAENFRHPRSGKPINKAGIHRILRNPIYFGEFRWKGKTYEGNHEPIIERSLFEKVQAQLDGHNYPVQSRRLTAYKGLIRCGRCGCKMTPEIHKEKYIYYRCTGFKGKCGNSYVREEKLGDLLGDVLKGIQIDEATVGYILEALKSSQQEKKQYHSESVDRLEKRIKQLQDLLDKAYNDKLEGKISEDYWLRRCQQWEDEIRSCRHQISRHDNANMNYYRTGVQILELANKAYFLYLRQNHYERRKLLDQVLLNCTFNNGSLSFSYKKPFDILAKGLENNKWRDYDPAPKAYYQVLAL